MAVLVEHVLLQADHGGTGEGALGAGLRLVGRDDRVLAVGAGQPVIVLALLVVIVLTVVGLLPGVKDKGMSRVYQQNQGYVKVYH